MQKFSKKNKQCERFLGKCKNKNKEIEKNRKHESRANRCEQVCVWVCACVWVLGNCARMEKLWNHHEKRCKFFPLPPRRTATCAANKASYKWMSWVSEWMHGGVSEWMREEWVSECMSAATCGKDNKCCWSKWKISVCALFAHSLPPFPRLLDCSPPPPIEFSSPLFLLFAPFCLPLRLQQLSANTRYLFVFVFARSANPFLAFLWAPCHSPPSCVGVIESQQNL